jgi:hypothetical protein
LLAACCSLLAAGCRLTGCRCTGADARRAHLAGIVELLTTLPPYARVLAVVDENLDLPEPKCITISGSYAIKEARARLTAAQDARLLALVRSANDGPDDVRLYLQRANGFLTKCPTEPDRKAILRHWFARFGTSTSQAPPVHQQDPADGPTDTAAPSNQCAPLSSTPDGTSTSDGENSFNSTTASDGTAPCTDTSLCDAPSCKQPPAPSDEPEAARRAVASAEAGKILAILHADTALPWNDTWRQLHRLKGLVSGTTFALADEAAAAECVVAMIDALRPLSATPADWADVYARLETELKPLVADTHVR